MGSDLETLATPGGSLIESQPGGANPMCDTLQDALIDTVRQLIGQPGITADQLQLAKLPVTAGGLGLLDLPTLALVARASCIATRSHGLVPQGPCRERGRVATGTPPRP